MSDESLIKRKAATEGAPESSSMAAKKPKPNTVETRESQLLDSSETANSQGKSFVIEAYAAEDKGSRHTMEDVWVVLPHAFPPHDSSTFRCAHFAVYDGHGGRLAAEYAQKHLNFNVISSGFPRGWLDGATAVCVWVLGHTVFVANVGDAKAVVARSIIPDGNESSSLKAILLTREHKVIYPFERSRIQKAGGLVSSNGRLQGRLEVSRAFGDRQFKKVGVIAVPDVQSFNVTERDQFIILGCDGLWGVLGPTDAVDFVHKLLKEGLPLDAVCRRLVKEAVYERGCKDNCTAVVIFFKRP
ncbi:hypothetical protein RND81_13G088900 [Saponaria officinalis]|uniref:PPM-type phosphatase domain-containing protein n=1 Tax=Saponaria officinalis TaxID=3572 RepID=A0AAW1GYF7_SAPOF